MKKVLVFVVVGMILLGGCVAVKTYTVEKPRVDTDIEGNRGYLAGTPKDEPRENKLGDTRQISVFEIEFGGQASEGTATTGEDQEAQMAEEVASYDDEDYGSDVYVEEIVVEEPQERYEYYIVNKNDTLQKISYRFYGTTKKWKYLHRVNEAVIKNPDRLYPGMKLKVPVLD